MMVIPRCNINPDLLPKGESLRQAVQWLSEHRRCTLGAIEEACNRFDLSPMDEEFLLRHFREQQRSAN